MPWNTSDERVQRAKFIEAVRSNEGDSFASICARFGISRETGYQLLRRHEALGAGAFDDRSRRPLHSPQAIGAAIEKQIVDLRTEHPTWGPRKLVAVLRSRSPRTQWPVASSVGDLLRRRGLSHPRVKRHRAAPFTQPLAHCVAANDVWCVDYKGTFKTLDGCRCNPLTITDAATRMLLRCNHLPLTGYGPVRAIFEATFREFGLPLAIRSDNGPPFGSTGVAGLSRLAVWFLRLGIWPERIEPGHPEQNGRHERMHRTLKETVTDHPSANTRLQQRAFDHFRTVFNEQRPHEALGMRPPSDFYVASPRPFPRVLPETEYPEGALVRSVRRTGEIKHKGRTHFLGEALAGEQVALWEVDGGWDVYFSVVRLGRFDARSGALIRVSDE